MRTATGTLRGFTLVEVLVALVIVALGMGAALAALTSAADNTARLRDRGFAQWIGFNQLSVTRLAQMMPSEGITTGDIEDFANTRWHWQQEVTPLETPGIYRITVRVRHADGAGDDGASWLANVTGFRGDALSPANGEQPNWNGSPPAGGQRAGGAGDRGEADGDGMGAGNAGGDDAAAPGGRGTGQPNPGAPRTGRGGSGGPGTGAPPPGGAPAPGTSGPPVGN